MKHPVQLGYSPGGLPRLRLNDGHVLACGPDLELYIATDTSDVSWQSNTGEDPIVEFLLARPVEHIHECIPRIPRAKRLPPRRTSE